jgi:hypothetical protein
MKIVFCFVMLALLSLPTWGQAKKDLVLSVSAGRLNSPYYSRAYPGGFVNLGFDYHLTERHILSVNYHSGRHRYLERRFSDPASYITDPGDVNAEAMYRTFSMTYKFKVLDLTRFSVAPSLGAGLMTHLLRYPVTQGLSTSFSYSAWTTLVFPVGLEMAYKLSDRWQLGLMGGFFIHPDYPVLGYHAGPRLSYVLR